MRDLISFAYDLPFGVENLISGGPKWAYADTFDIEAKAESDVEAKRGDRSTGAQATTLDRMMLQNLLASRFKLRIHREAKEIHGFALTVAHNDPKLKPANAHLGAGADSNRTYAFGANLPTPNAGHLAMRLVRGDIHAPQATMGWLAGYLQFQPELQGQTVMDKTGLAGSFDISLRWSTEGAGGGNSTKSDSELPSLFDALQEQLGLKLQSERVETQSIVIDHIEQPSEN